MEAESEYGINTEMYSVLIYEFIDHKYSVFAYISSNSDAWYIGRVGWTLTSIE